jgi:hypothetical protein
LLIRTSITYITAAENVRQNNYSSVNSETDLYGLTSIIRIIKSGIMRRAGHVAHMGEKRNVKRPLGRLRCRWEDNIRMDLREIGWGEINWRLLKDSAP